LHLCPALLSDIARVCAMAWPTLWAINDSDVLRFDPVSEVWSMLAPTLANHVYGSTFVLGGYLYAAGGSSHLTNLERYDGASNTWSAVANMLEGRHFSCAVTIRSVGPAEEQDLFDSLIAKAAHQSS
jgi:hypothetical protein